MTTNFNKFREKMEQAKSKKTSTPNQINWMKLDSGKRYTLRFLPLKSENMELPISIFHHHAVTFPDGHYESVACPKRIDNSDCPFCKLATEQYKKFVSTENLQYKEAFKKLVVKTHYLLVGFEPSEIDPSNITAEDVKVVRASSKNNMELIESKLTKEIDFVDFKTGRNVELFKSKSKGTGKGTDITTIVWDFGDPEVAVSGRDGKEVWDKLVELSPDLTAIVTPMSAAMIEKKFAEFSSQPVVADEVEEVDEKPVISMAAPKATVKVSTNKDLDIDELQRMMEDDN
jgi:hypothetical protein